MAWRVGCGTGNAYLLPATGECKARMPEPAPFTKAARPFAARGSASALSEGAGLLQPSVRTKFPMPAGRSARRVFQSILLSASLYRPLVITLVPPFRAAFFGIIKAAWLDPAHTLFCFEPVLPGSEDTSPPNRIPGICRRDSRAAEPRDADASGAARGRSRRHRV